MRQHVLEVFGDSIGCITKRVEEFLRETHNITAHRILIEFDDATGKLQDETNYSQSCGNPEMSQDCGYYPQTGMTSQARNIGQGLRRASRSIPRR